MEFKAGIFRTFLYGHLKEKRKLFYVEKKFQRKIHSPVHIHRTIDTAINFDSVLMKHLVTLDQLLVDLLQSLEKIPTLYRFEYV